MLLLSYLLFTTLSTIQLVHAQLMLRKCCPEHQLLNEYHLCVDHPSYPLTVGHLLKKSLNCDQLEEGCQLSVVGHTGCPFRERTESQLLSLLEQNTFNMAALLSQGCVDMASLANNGPLEGPLLISCTGGESSPQSGFVTKCCPSGQVMSSDLKSCVLHPGVDSLLLLPPRMIRNAGNSMTSGQYHMEYRAAQLGCESNEMAVFQQPTYLLTNGTAYFDTGSDYLEGKQYQCLDKYMVDDELGETSKSAITLVCQPLSPEAAVADSNVDPHAKSGPECGSNVELCVPKCCPVNEMFHVDLYRCVLTNDSQKIYAPEDSSGGGKSIGIDEFYVRHMHNYECPGLYEILPASDVISLDAASGLLVRDNGLTVTKYKSGFCIDNFYSEHKGLYASAFICPQAEFEVANKTTKAMAAFTNGTCGDKYLVAFNKRLRSAYTFCGLFSLIFLVITLFVYMTLPNLKNLHGKIVMSNVTSVLITTILLVLIYNVQKSNAGEIDVSYNGEFLIFVPSSVCSGLGYTLYYAGISMFCWMSVMCIDLCWTFARATIPRKGSDRMKFICYSLFGWGMPLMMAVLTALFDVFPNWGSVRPQMGHSSCFLSIRGARFFFYMPILILLCFNTLMYLVTVYSLWKTKKASKKAGLNRVNTASRGRNFATSMTPTRESALRGNCHVLKSTSAASSGSGSFNSDTREQLVLFTKLFLIMGLSWLSECIHIELHGDHTDMVYCNFYLEVFLRVIGGLNMIRGFFIFLVFICKPKIWNLARKRHPKLWNFLSCCRLTSRCCCDDEASNICEEESRLSMKFEARVELNRSPPNSAARGLQPNEAICMMNRPELINSSQSIVNVNEDETLALRSNANKNGVLSHNKSFLSVRSTYLTDNGEEKAITSPQLN